MEYVGFANYLRLLTDMDFWFAFKNNVILIVLCIVLQIGIALVLSLLLTSKIIKLKEIHRTVIFFPAVLSPVVVGILWTLIYNKDIGILNWFLRSAGLKSLIKPWLDDPSGIMFYVSLPVIWQYIGIYLMIFVASIKSIPNEILEVAELDGVSGVKRSVYIIIPLLFDTLKLAIMLSIAGNIKIFDHIYILTGGGPGKSSMVMAQYAYINSFKMFKFGYSSAISIGMLILSFLLIMISRKLSPSTDI